jgi:galactokinase
MSASVLVLDKEHKKSLDAGFAAAFGKAPERYFSAPGRTEIGGNHTDHQRGRVLAAAVNLDVRAAVALNGSDEMRVLSKGYEMICVNINELQPVEAEINSTPALIRGVAARFKQLGCELQGFDAYCETDVLQGSGLSSSAAFEVLVGTIIKLLCKL